MCCRFSRQYAACRVASRGACRASEQGLTVGVGGEQNMAAFTIGYQNGYSDSKKANSPGGQGYAAAYKSGLMTGMTVRRRPSRSLPP